MRILRRLIRVLRAGLCARAGACGRGVRRHPPSLKSPNAILELSDAKFAEVFGVILTDGSRGTETTHVSPTMDLRVCQMKRRERAPQPIKKKYIQSNLFSYNALLFLAWSCFSSFLFLPAVRTGTALGSAPSMKRWRHKEEKIWNTIKHHDEDLYGFLCMEVWYPNVPALTSEFLVRALSY